MIALPAVAAAPARPSMPADNATEADGEGGGGFAAALEAAQEPATQGATVDEQPRVAADAGQRGGADAKPRASVDAKAKGCVGAKAEAACGEAQAVGDDSAQATADAVAKADAPGPDLTALLPGWPPAPVVTPAMATTTAITAGAADKHGKTPVPSLAETDTRVRWPAPGNEPARGEPREGKAASRDALPAAMAAPDKPAKPVAAASFVAAGNEAIAPPQAGKNAAESALPAAMFAPTAASPLVQAALQATPHFGFNALTPTASAPFEGRLAAAIDTPAFAPALASQVTWLANEGLQQARITLNPAEMGPLAVRIVLDGTQARIDFSADMAGTRAAIEASLPTLAAALHDSGLTLAGGGVFDGQARQGTPDGRPTNHGSPMPTGHGPTSGVGAQATAPVRAARGLVDLVA